MARKNYGCIHQVILSEPLYASFALNFKLIFSKPKLSSFLRALNAERFWPLLLLPPLLFS